MFLKTPKASTDQRVRSLLQKAVRRGYSEIVKAASTRLDKSGDKAWLRSRTVVITFEECWPLASSLSIDRELGSKQHALLKVTQGAKQKDAASLGAFAHAFHEGDQSMLDYIPDRYVLRIVSEALNRPDDFFRWALDQSKTECATRVISCAQRYLAVATWPWDKACILAGALLSTVGEMRPTDGAEKPSGDFPYWIALDKHTPQGKIAMRETSKLVNSSYRQLIWAGFYCESAFVNRLLPSPWWDAEKMWRLRRAGLSIDAATDLWTQARPHMRQRLEGEAAILRDLIEASDPAYPKQMCLNSED